MSDDMTTIVLSIWDIFGFILFVYFCFILLFTIIDEISLASSNAFSVLLWKKECRILEGKDPLKKLDYIKTFWKLWGGFLFRDGELMFKNDTGYWLSRYKWGFYGKEIKGDDDY